MKPETKKAIKGKRVMTFWKNLKRLFSNGRKNQKPKMPELTGKQLGLTSVKGRLLETKEVAAFMRVSTRWVQNQMQNGMFPIRWYPVGPHGHMVDSADVDEWLRKIRSEAGEALIPPKAVKKITKEEVIA